MEKAVPTEARPPLSRRLKALRVRSASSVLVLLTAIFVARLILATTVIPPWQNPDEPQHLAFVRTLALEPDMYLEQHRREIEREIVQSMAEHGWWRHYRAPVPNPLPTDFSSLSDHIVRVETSARLFYYLAVAYLKGLGVTDLLSQYYALRWAAVVMAVMTLWCVWRGSDLLFGRDVAIGTTGLVAFQPQFALMSISVNPDVLVNLLGAIIWWQGARLAKGVETFLPVVLIASVAVAGVFTKRVAASFVGMAAVAAISACALARLVSRRGITGLALLMAVTILVGAHFARSIQPWDYLLTFSVSDQALSLDFFTRFTATLFDSAWLSAGWLRYPGPPSWTLTLRGLNVAAFIGLSLGLIRFHFWRRSIAAAASIVIVQIAAIYVGLYLNGFAPQGRYLFPVIAPWMAMFWIGIHSWWPRRLWPLVGTVVLATMFFVDQIAWFGTIVPAFLE